MALQEAAPWLKRAGAHKVVKLGAGRVILVNGERYPHRQKPLP
jgi:hypothetical protein